MDPTRRYLLLGTGGALGAVALAAPAAAGVAQANMALLSTYVAGTAYHDASAARLRPGDLLALRRDRRNDYDPRAIEVRTRTGLKLGYIPRSDNHALANLMDAGFDVIARVRQILPDRRQPEIRLDVFMTL